MLSEEFSDTLSVPDRPDGRLFWLLLLFVSSGCAALIYEIVWLQLLQLVIGLTTASLGVLLGTFMGGMCLGSLLLPRFVSSKRHPLRVYALLELGIGIIGLGVLWLVPIIADAYSASGWNGLAVRGVVAGICLLPPTLLMGATLPAMARWVEATPRGVSWLGFFYGGNIAGAVFGCLLAGFYLLRVHDMATATYVAVLINVAVAAVALALAARTDRTSVPQPKANLRSDASGVAPRGGSQSDVPSGNSWPIYLCIGLSGASALGAEVVWTRLLSLLMGATVYTFSIILAVFLAGLGIGSSIGSFLARSMVRPRLALGWCQLSLIGAVAWTACMIAYSLPHWPVNPTLALSPWYTFQLDLARCLWAILPAAILWGASFPLALAAVARRGQDPGRLVGGVYGANTVGAIIGALGFSVLVIPWIGTQWGQRLIIGLAGVSALVALLGCSRGSQEAEDRGQGAGVRSQETDGAGDRVPLFLRFAVPTISIIALSALLAWSVAPLPWGVIAYGRFAATYGNRFSPGIWEEGNIPSGGGAPDIFAIYVGEGRNGSIAVTKLTSGVRNFHSAGKVQASNDRADMRLQRMLGHISALAHPKPESVLVVACGAGVTAGTFVVHPEVKRIVICDIEPLVPKVVAPMFAKENYNVVADPRTQVIGDDGRHFIRTTQEKFDIITSDPIDPWVKGSAALNTVEYYEMCKAHLKPGGVMSLWIPLYESNAATAKSVIATFFKVFPNGILWSNENQGEGYDAVLFGQAEPTRLNLDEIHDRLQRPDHARVLESLREADFNSVISLFSTYAGQAGDLGDWMRDAEINTDRNLRLQYLAGMSVNSFVGSEILAQITLHYKFPENVFLGSEQRKQMLRTAIGGKKPGG